MTASPIDSYIAAQPPAARRELRRMRAAIRKAAPEAVEAFSYRIPGFTLDGRPLIYYAGWKSHVSVYPITATIQRAEAAALSKYETAKGTIRFPLSAPVPLALLGRLVKARIGEVRSKTKASAAAKKKTQAAR
jgi:uncharacterized protein YdhG (YjbR/CyaY superfamily)